MNVVATPGLCAGCRESPEPLTTPESSEQLIKNRESLDEWLARGNQPQEGVSMNCFRPSYHRLHEITDDAGVELPTGIPEGVPRTQWPTPKDQEVALRAKKWTNQSFSTS